MKNIGTNMKTISQSLILFGLFCFLNHNSYADWTGKMLVKSQDGKLNVEAKVSAKGDLQRFDVVAMGQNVSTLIDMQTYKATLLMHAAKMAMNTKHDPKMSGSMCSSKDIEGCFKKQGLKQTGEETKEGHPCLVYEGNMNDGKDAKTKTKVKIWRPKDLAEVASVRTELTPSDGNRVDITLSDIKVASLDKNLFNVPTDYKKMDGLDLKALMQMQQGAGKK